MDCAVTEQCGAANFKTEFTVSVEFCAADKFHCSRAANTVNTVKNLSLLHFRFHFRFRFDFRFHFHFRFQGPRRAGCQLKKPFKGSSSGSNVRVEVEGPFS